MLFNEPRSTPYDINFKLLGFPVRVHPLFFLMPLLLGSWIISAKPAGLNSGVVILVLCVVFFISILVHELGHTLAFRFYGIGSRILLYWLGGLAIPGANNVWSNSSYRRLGSNEQIVVSLAGPAFGFALAGVMAGMVYLLGGRVVAIWDGVFPSVYPQFAEDAVGAKYPALVLFLWIGLWCNVFWNVLNLLPVYPLDGGQVARQIFLQLDYRNGLRNSLYLSVGAAGAIALFGLTRQDHFMALFFGYMAFTSYQSLQFGGGFGGRPW